MVVRNEALPLPTAAVPTPAPSVVVPAEAEPFYPEIAIPNEPEVNRFVRVFNGERRNCVRDAYFRRQQYRDLVETTLLKYGLPTDLIHVAMVESSFKPAARSRSGAVGLWQFIASTARHYGLQVGKGIDERKDVEKATEAAAQHLLALYQTYDDWSLALAAYNAGEGAVNRAIARGRTRDFFRLSRLGYFRSETVNYVSQFMALTLIHRDIAAYAFDSEAPDFVQYAQR